ncbi:DUF432 domain-containing protein [Fodinibius sp. Rm-B-1B1-1]|uniref:DUF432 domain-containing protein n=1 Tax=Fodinibius alkaliphilus TaxID=3140241 RepID=UPI00315A97D1
MDTDIWGKQSLEEGKTKHISVGELHIWLKYRNEEVWITQAYNDEIKRKADLDQPPKDAEWSRWAHKNSSAEVAIQPVFPDKPLVIHSEYSLKISPETQIQIYTRIPVWIRISLADNDYQLTELPSVKLSRTWFGTEIEGELCYHAKTKARRDLSHVDKKPYLVSCPIKIVNKSVEELTFSHFCFRVERLSMFYHEHELWADETQIIYQGEDLHSEVIMTGKLHKGITKKQLLSKPRKQVHKSLATRTFKRFFKVGPTN